MKIIDSFIFFNELDMLNYRLSILDEYVDYFVLVEGKYSFSGVEKDLYYEINKEIFNKFNHKIIHIVLDEFPYKFPNINYSENQQWMNENYSRNGISIGINKLNLNNEDIIITSDLDEIPNPNILKNLRKNKLEYDKNNLNRLACDMYYYNLNTLIGRSSWHGIKLITFETYKKLGLTFQDMRTHEFTHEVPIIPNGGWHLSYFGDIEYIKNKIKNFSHQEFNNSKYVNDKFIKDHIYNKKNLFNESAKVEYIPTKENNNLPPEYDKYLKKYYIMVINLNNLYLDEFKMINFEYLVTSTYYNLNSGEQEYRLYSYLSTLFNDTIILDLGTSHGTSAVALSHNINNKVITYDIINCINNDNHLIYKKHNIEFRIKNVLDDLNEEFVSKIKIVMIDIDHYGNVEKDIIDKLYKLNFSGIIILDDVFNHPDYEINNCMNTLWNKLDTYKNTKKVDVSKYGHWTGTGILLMNTDIELILD